jgi:hypothetical protein
METATKTEFDRIENSTLGQGKTTEYKTPRGETLVYIDYAEDGATAAVTVFTPYKGGERRYTSRPTAKAEAIATKHLAKEGYELPAEEAAAAEDREQQIAEARKAVADNQRMVDTLPGPGLARHRWTYIEKVREAQAKLDALLAEAAK